MSRQEICIAAHCPCGKIYCGGTYFDILNQKAYYLYICTIGTCTVNFETEAFINKC